MTHSSVNPGPAASPADSSPHDPLDTADTLDAPLPPPARPGLRKMPAAIAGLMLALIAWGLYLAVGTAIFHREDDSARFDPVRFGIVVATSGLFLGGWLLLLAFRRPRPRPANLPTQPPSEEEE